MKTHPWTTCQRCGMHYCAGHSSDQCEAALEYGRIAATGDQSAIDEHLGREQAKIDAAAPRLYCGLCKKEFIGLAHRHFVGGRLTYEVVADVNDGESDSPTTLALEGRP